MSTTHSDDHGKGAEAENQPSPALEAVSDGTEDCAIENLSEVGLRISVLGKLIIPPSRPY